MPKVLVADDSSDTRLFMWLVLTDSGFEVIQAENGQEALDRAVEEKPDLILMDISMPVMDGVEAARLIHADPATKHIPIVAISAHLWDGAWIEKTREVGFIECCPKPVDIDLITTLVGKYVSHQN